MQISRAVALTGGLVGGLAGGLVGLAIALPSVAQTNSARVFLDYRNDGEAGSGSAPVLHQASLPGLQVP